MSPSRRPPTTPQGVWSTLAPIDHVVVTATVDIVGRSNRPMLVVVTKRLRASPVDWRRWVVAMSWSLYPTYEKSPLGAGTSDKDDVDGDDDGTLVPGVGSVGIRPGSGGNTIAKHQTSKIAFGSDLVWGYGSLTRWIAYTR